MSGKTVHLGDEGDNKARWGRSSDYRKKAMEGIKAKTDRKNRYDSIALLSKTLSNVNPKPEVSATGQQTKIQSGSAAHCARYKLACFISGSTPYPNHAHHMIPANAFINRFTSDQQNILRKIEYDVNNGNNLIFLPSNYESMRYHLLPWHQTDDFHEPYSDEVKNSAKEIENKINKVLDKAEPCTEQSPPDDLVEEMVIYENKLWNLIVNLGPKSINEIKIS